MNYYQKRIIEITGCNLKEAEDLEDIMRHTLFQGTLDGVYPEQFEQAARDAKDVLAYMRNNPEEMMTV